MDSSQSCVSGTNCWIHGHLVAKGTRRITEAKVWIDCGGSHLLRAWYQWDGQHQTATKDIQCDFSSTQFPCNSVLTLRIECWDTANAKGQGEKQANNWNRTYALYNSYRFVGDTDAALEFRSNTASDAKDRSVAMHHAVDGPFGNHSRSEILAPGSMLSRGTVFFMATHGNPAPMFKDCTTSDILPSEIADPKNAIAAKSTYPFPFGYPGYSLVFIAACYQAQEAMRAAFRTPAVLIGWEDLVLMNEVHRTYANCIWLRLASGQPVSEAVVNAPEDTYAALNIHPVTFATWIGDGSRVIHRVYPEVTQATLNP